MTTLTHWLTAALALLLLTTSGCANVIAGTTTTEIRDGVGDVSVDSMEYRLLLIDESSRNLTRSSDQIESGRLQPLALKTERLTIRTPRTQETVRQVVPYRGKAEFIEVPLHIIGSPILILQGEIETWITGMNPFMNIERGTPRAMETVSSTVLPERVEPDTRSTPIPGAEIQLRLEKLPAIAVRAKNLDPDGHLAVEDLLTGRLDALPTTISGRMRVPGEERARAVQASISDDLAHRLYLASQLPLRPNAARHSIESIAIASVTLDELKFPRQAERVRRAGINVFGASAFSQARAEHHMELAVTHQGRQQWSDSLNQIASARRLAGSPSKSWNRIEADSLEGRGFVALEAQDYARARADLLRASTLDRSRQPRLASFVSMAIEASDRAEDRKAALARREQEAARATAAQNVSSSVSPASPAGSGNGVADMIQQCLARKAAMQGCNLMPGFGKEICKASVRGKFAGLACP